MKNTFHVTSEYRGVRVDKFLFENMGTNTRGEIIRMIKSGAVLINGKKIKPSLTLKGGEIINVGEYEEKTTEILPNKNVFVEIVENTPDFIVINKPRGLQVHPSHREREKTVVNALLAKFPEIKSVGDDEERPGIVHRIDKDTTGLLIVAKNQQTFDTLKTLFSEKNIQKTYHAIVCGHLQEKSGIIDAPIARATSYTKQKIAFGKYKGDARSAQTTYCVQEEYMIDDVALSLVEVKPQTGRTHQIRVHMAHIGHPLLGDQRYYTKNERKIVLNIPKEYAIETFFLHAKEISFYINGKKQHFNIKYPDRFHALVHFLQAFRIK
ncbi:MAG: hypothetical protein CR972_05140 [Candidatus Moraniibacteriota bacterium]|nr:MAG: hypothetical protein CR972_05140 [Candidatus Moranbacteria bacterium]